MIFLRRLLEKLIVTFQRINLALALLGEFGCHLPAGTPASAAQNR
jgi:hypothetical protein